MIQTEYNAFPVIIKAINKLVDLVKVTFGPAGNKVIIPADMVNFKPQALDDGVAISKKFQLENEFENSVVEIVKEVAIKTNTRVGDGTTGSLIILQAIMNQINSLGQIDARKVVKELNEAAVEAKETLTRAAKKITNVVDLEKVARISIDNPEIAKVIANLVFKIGHDGVITVQTSNTLETTHEHVEGFEFEKGYLAPFMVTNPSRMEAEFDRPKILLTDYRISTAVDMVKIMEKLASAGHRQFVIICDGVENDALATLYVNRAEGKFLPLVITLPGDAEVQQEFLTDIAAVTGGTVVSRSKGMKLEDFEVKMLGKADKILAKAESTVIIGGQGKKADIQTQINEVKLLQKDALGNKLALLNIRLGRLVNGVAVIKVGAATEQAMQALKYKVEDAVNAVKTAYRSGIVCGGGLSLIRLKTQSMLLNKALQEPYKQLLKNSGVDAPLLGKDEALNIVTGKQGNFLDVGVVDPVEVLIAQIESSISIASLLITTKGIIADVKEKQHETYTKSF